VFALVSIFIVLGATTHVLAILNVWLPLALLDGIVKAMTAIAAIVTVVVLAPLLPKLTKLPSPIADSLTSLPNRLLFVDRVGLALARMKRENRELLAILLVDLDGFRRVNDSLGHAVGDQLLVRVAKRLGKVVRAADTVARSGGDEFILLVERVEGPLYAKGVARRIISELERPFPFGEVQIALTASIGIVISDGSEGPEDLVAAAEASMCRAKELHRGGFELDDRSFREAPAVV
jgi:diguanylate cyclase (GGDEF)-like protein